LFDLSPVLMLGIAGRIFYEPPRSSQRCPLIVSRKSILPEDW
jgi:hypothetical protein